VWRTRVGDRYRLGHRPVGPHNGSSHSIYSIAQARSIMWDGSMYSHAHVNPSHTKAPGGERGLGTNANHEKWRAPNP